MMEEHRYSPFALDLYWMNGARDPDLAAHLATCERCRAYVDQLRALDARPFALPSSSTPARRWRFVAALALAVAAAAALVWWLRPAPDRTPTYVAAKSAPGVQVLVHRDGETHPWSTDAKIHARDALALRVACEGMPRVSVLAADGGNWTRTFEGPCRDDVLPFTLVVDDAPGAERIGVVLSRAPLDEAAARRAVDPPLKTADVWALTFVFDKELLP